MFTCYLQTKIRIPIINGSLNVAIKWQLNTNFTGLLYCLILCHANFLVPEVTYISLTISYHIKCHSTALKGREALSARRFFTVTFFVSV
jgi:hypothetical protein